MFNQDHEIPKQISAFYNKVVEGNCRSTINYFWTNSLLHFVEIQPLLLSECQFKMIKTKQMVSWQFSVCLHGIQKMLYFDKRVDAVSFFFYYMIDV
jgi:hypothetical protein